MQVFGGVSIFQSGASAVECLGRILIAPAGVWWNLSQHEEKSPKTFAVAAMLKESQKLAFVGWTKVLQHLQVTILFLDYFSAKPISGNPQTLLD